MITIISNTTNEGDESYFVTGSLATNEMVNVCSFLNDVKPSIKTKVESFIKKFITNDIIHIINYDGDLDIEFNVSKKLIRSEDGPFEIDYLKNKVVMDELISLITKFNAI